MQIQHPLICDANGYLQIEVADSDPGCERCATQQREGNGMTSVYRGRLGKVLQDDGLGKRKPVVNQGRVWIHCTRCDCARWEPISTSSTQSSG